MVIQCPCLLYLHLLRVISFYWPMAPPKSSTLFTTNTKQTTHDMVSHKSKLGMQYFFCELTYHEIVLSFILFAIMRRSTNIHSSPAVWVNQLFLFVIPDPTYCFLLSGPSKIFLRGYESSLHLQTFLLWELWS